MFDQPFSATVADREGQIRARALNMLAFITALMALAYALVSIFVSPAELTLGVIAALALAFVLGMGCFWLSKRGHVRSAGYLFFGGLFVAISAYLASGGTTISDLTMAPFLYILVILPIGYVIHPRLSFITATLAVAYTIGLMLLAPPPAYLAYDNKANYWSNVGLAFVLFYLLSAVAWIFSQGLSQALQQAESQNEELRRTAQEIKTQQQVQREIGQQISELAELLAQYSNTQSRGSTRQAAAISQVSASIEELNRTACNIAENVEVVDRAAQQTLEEAQRGQQAVAESNVAMVTILGKAQNGADEAGRLKQDMKQIRRVAALVGNIATQIQLVAFNATLEAAEAGEAGHRFGVVAAEVKDLATDSLKQAKQVTETIRQVQETGETVVNLSEDQMEAVLSGSELMGQSNEANQAIIDSAAHVAEQARQIQQATTQQQAASEQLAAAMHEIKGVVDRWVVSSYQMDEMVASLRELAEKLT